MDLHTWALILFTLLGQMAVGAFLVLGVVHTVALRHHESALVDRLTDRSLLAIGPVLVLAFIASLFHLGSPTIAFRAVTNVETSWLAREIVTGVAFLVLGGAFALLQWRKIGSFAARRTLAVVAAIVGVAFVLSMAAIYMLPTQPAWNTAATPIAFLATALLLGTLAVGVAFIASYAYLRRHDDERVEALTGLLQRSLRWLGVGAVALVAVQLVTVPLHVAALSAAGGAAADSAAQMLQGGGLVLGLRLVLAVAGAAIVGALVLRSFREPLPVRTMSAVVPAAFGVVLISELLGRYLFYAANVPIVI